MSQTSTAAHRWQHVPGQELALLARDLVLVRYHFATDLRKAFIHPLHLPGGTLMTWNEPPDHVHHHGLWFAWKHLPAANYWEERPEDRGSTELTLGEQVEILGGRAVVRTSYRYCPAGGEAILDEERVVTAHFPDAEGSIRFDWSHSFTARDSAVEIDSTPISEFWWGGYAGLSWRAARSLGNFRAIDSEGRQNQAVEHQRARWADLSGTTDDGGPAAGIAIFDHPENPRHPTHWRCILERSAT